MATNYPAESDWLPVPIEIEGKVKTPAHPNLRYNVNCPKKSLVTHDVLETKTTTTSWAKGTHWAQLKKLSLAVEMPPKVRERLISRIEKLVEYDALHGNEAKLTQSREAAASEQQRIKTLMVALNREDELHSRYLKKLSGLESEIESTSETLINVRKKLEESKSRLSQDES